MKAVILSQPGATPEVRDDIDVPEPGEGEILVKTIYTAINPVYTFSPSCSPFPDPTFHSNLASMHFIASHNLCLSSN